VAYCRWSTDSFRCDVYAYEAEDGYMIHVAGRKRAVPGDLNQPSLHPEDMVSADDYAARYKAWDDAYQALPWRNIVTPSAGKSFHEPTLEAFRARMQALRAEGIRFPDTVLEEIAQEIMERDAALGPKA
jgi:hypothetical protein